MHLPELISFFLKLRPRSFCKEQYYSHVLNHNSCSYFYLLHRTRSSYSYQYYFITYWYMQLNHAIILKLVLFWQHNKKAFQGSIITKENLHNNLWHLFTCINARCKDIDITQVLYQLWSPTKQYMMVTIKLYPKEMYVTA